jgi:O-antigen ligase
MTSSRSAWLLAAMMVLAPALGSHSEELLQDTLKSIVVSFFALSVALVFFWEIRKGDHVVHVHGLLVFPVSLMLYALGSMAWSHTYLGGVEAIRWFVFSVILFVGLNSLTPNRMTALAWGVHIGAVIASLWTALQFWVEFSFFAQGPNPASTFVNRNFFGEFVVCTFPYSVLLLMRVRDKTSVYFLTFSLAFNCVALMMTGTRSALTGLVLLSASIPFILYRCRRQVVSSGWNRRHVAAVTVVFLATVTLLGSISSTNSRLIADGRGGTALSGAAARLLSLTDSREYSERSFSIRAVMWKATARMIVGNPLAGVGAGAWEVASPLYQNADTTLETDYYAHNEFLQLIAEYGVVGWLVLVCLAAYLFWSVRVTLNNTSEQGQREAPIRALALASVGVLLLVSNAGFPWRMATTGALFAISLAALGASDIRLGLYHKFGVRMALWRHRLVHLCFGTTVLCGFVAIYIAQQAIACESKIVRAVKIALTISLSGQPTDPRWQNLKADMLELVREGIAINPHYRKLTPIVADSLANWGDWKNATWIWESVLESRPNVVAVVTNLVRGHLQEGNLDRAAELLERLRKLQPDAAGLASLEVMLWSRSDRKKDAADRAKELIRAGTVEPDLLRTAYFIGMQIPDHELAILALEVRIKTWPDQAVDGYLKLGNIYVSAHAKNEAKAMESYRLALASARAEYREQVLGAIPETYRAKLRQQ